jgi:hypothetical protein
VAVGIAFFTVARVYAAATDKARERSVVRDTLTHHGNLHAGLLLIRIQGLGEKGLEKVRRGLERHGIEPKSVELLKTHQRGIWSLLENTLAISWALPMQQGASRIACDAEVMTTALTQLLRQYPDTTATWHFHQGTIVGGECAWDEWQRLLADALLGGHEQKATQDTGGVV